MHQECNCTAAHFERDHAANIKNYNFKACNLILVWNMAIEKVLKRKMWPHYTGPLAMVSCNHGGAYILCKLDGTLLHAPFAAFHIILYFAHENIDIPDIQKHINVTAIQLQEMEDAMDQDPKDQFPIPTDTPDATGAEAED